MNVLCAFSRYSLLVTRHYIEVGMKTVLITGASSGIGKALTDSFARRGYRLAVVGRNGDALQALVDQHPHSPIHPIVIDLSKPDSGKAVFDELSRQGISIDILVNNAGFGLWGPFDETKVQSEHEMIQLQINTPLDLIKHALPHMKKKKEGHIINIGSLYCFCPVPRQSVYSASKSFMLSFSQSLRYEMQHQGILVTVVCPGMTMSSFRTRAGLQDKKSWLSMEPEAVAEAAYEGMRKKKFLVIPGWMNKCYVFAIRILPMSLVTPVAEWIIYSLRKLDVKTKD